MKFQPDVLATKQGRLPDFQMLSIIVSPLSAISKQAALLAIIIVSCII